VLKIVQQAPCLTQKKYPSLIKYMGSKSKIMDFVLSGINEVHDGRSVCDLFAGSGSLAGAIGDQATVYSNDVQVYSGILADTYNKAFLAKGTPDLNTIMTAAEKIVDRRRRYDPSYYEGNLSLDAFNEIEKFQQGLLSESFEYEWHLFAKNYSGTWWSYDQCLWIDALREIADDYKLQPIFPALISSLMFAMAYSSQGTGHYAQYRDAKTSSSQKDILIYRRRSVAQYFSKKYQELMEYLPSEMPYREHKSTSLDYVDFLNSYSGGTIYADPPYCFVHYSRFYHALETVVRYDFPKLQVQRGKIVKGRYRETRHQSPFCIKSKVDSAFDTLFQAASKSGSNIVLSYSNTGMISLEALMDIARVHYGRKKLEVMTIDHHHMTMGRKDDRHRQVKEALIIARP
jgi:adenine-specific DNA-methyltransferase